ncbi:MAG: nuclear transport factor 2 family protein [Bacteroidota bacterium]
MQTLIEKFYNSFQALDAEGMVECYHENIVFEDPAFGVLKGERAKNMWRMLCESQKGKDFKITFSEINGDDHTGSALWQAFYTFSKTNRKVHNVIQAKFEFKDGKIIKHTDNFDLYTWSKQAMGLKGVLLGRTGFFKNKLKQSTSKMLDKFENRL